MFLNPFRKLENTRPQALLEKHQEDDLLYFSILFVSRPN